MEKKKPKENDYYYYYYYYYCNQPGHKNGLLHLFSLYCLS